MVDSKKLPVHSLFGLIAFFAVMRETKQAMTSFDILIVDDHAMFRNGLSLLLRAALPDVCVAEAGSLEGALQANVTCPAVVLLDIHLPSLNGLECMSLLKMRWPDTAIVVLSADAVDATIRSALERGAVAFIAKTSPATVVLDAVQKVLRGERPLRAITSIGTVERLTPRQCQVLDLLCQGLPNKTIGKRLNLSENTVRGHVQSILAFLQVCSRTEAVVEARRRGLVA